MAVLESFAGKHYYFICKIAQSELEFGPSCLAFPMDRGVCVQALIGPCLSNASGVSLEGRSAPLTLHLGLASHPYSLCSDLSARPHKVRELS